MNDTDFLPPEYLAYEEALKRVQLEHPASVALDPGKDYSKVFHQGEPFVVAQYGNQHVTDGTSVITGASIYIESSGFAPDRIERLHCDSETLTAALAAPLKRQPPPYYNVVGRCSVCHQRKMLRNSVCAGCARQMSKEG